jgi:dihydropteroate synthase
MTKKRLQWKIRNRELILGERSLIMGVLNVTPDSFSDGGNYSDPDRAFAHAMELEEQGADIIDIGAESTRPGSSRISEAEELRRLIPVLKRLKGRLNVPISVDTYKAAVAEKAIEHGADIINDPSGLTWDPGIAKVAAQHDAGLILTHMRGTPETWAKLGPLKDVMVTIRAELEASVNRARRAGVAKERIVIDPGIGFGKRREQNAEILALLGQLQPLLVPVLVGPSRKSFLAQKDAMETEFATAAAVTTAILNGASIVRVHNVAAMKPVFAVADAIVAAMPDVELELRPARRPRPDVERPPVAAPQSRPEREPERERVPEKKVAPPRREWTDRPKQDGDKRPPRRDFGPPKRDDRPPRRDFGPSKRDDRPPRRDFGPPKRDERPPRRDFGPPKRDDRPPRRDSGPPKRDDRPPRRDEGRPGFRDRPPRREQSGGGSDNRRGFKPRSPGRGPKPGGGRGRPPGRGPGGSRGGPKGR